VLFRSLRPARPWSAGDDNGCCRGDDGAAGTSVQPRGRLRVERRFDVAPSKVFDAWLNPEIAAQWLFATATRKMADVEIDARVHGTFRFANRFERSTIEYRGTYVELIPYRGLVFTLALPSDPATITRVRVEIVPTNQGAYLTLTHQDVPLDDVSYFERRWTGILYGLGETLDALSEDSTISRSDQ
jgi:uncharacterized protein YndB with AHSA1/START domain